MNQLENLGAFAPEAPIKATITLDDKTADIFVRVVSYAEMQALLNDELPKDVKSRDAFVVAKLLRLGDDAADSLTAEQAGNLLPTWFRAIRDEVYIQNGLMQRVAPAQEVEPEK
jgi:hypothetical protein